MTAAAPSGVDGDYFGTVLNRAARVMAAGHGGQILVADSTAVLLSGIDLVDLGPRRLRDLPTPVGLFQIRGPGLRTDFPPLRALDTSPGNLRPAVTTLIGRDADVPAIEAAVRTHRLVTLTGAGGVGKTRLAVEAAAHLAGELPDGIWVFELAAVADPAAVPDAVAAVLGITQQPGKSVSESVASVLEGRSRLLVFDNCEHVVYSVADLVEAILAASATTKVLATSREGIGVADEQLWRCPRWTSVRPSSCLSNVPKASFRTRWLMRRPWWRTFVVASMASRWRSSWRPHKSSTRTTSFDLRPLRPPSPRALGTAAGLAGAFAVAWTMSGWRTAETQRGRLSGRA